MCQNEINIYKKGKHYNVRQAVGDRLSNMKLNIRIAKN